MTPEKGTQLLEALAPITHRQIPSQAKTPNDLAPENGKFFGGRRLEKIAVAS